MKKINAITDVFIVKLTDQYETKLNEITLVTASIPKRSLLSKLCVILKVPLFSSSTQDLSIKRGNPSRSLRFFSRRQSEI
jgi:hypothetical protein